MAVTTIAFLGLCLVLHGPFTVAHKTAEDDHNLVTLIVNQAVQLQKLEHRLEQQESQMTRQESEVIQLKSQLTQQESEMIQLTSQLQQQTNQTQQQTEKLQELEGEVTSLENHVDLNSANLKAFNHTVVKQEATVAFYAIISRRTKTASGVTLIFDHAVTNVGNAYNTSSGIFTAPVSGLYRFQTTFRSAKTGKDGYSYTRIYVDKKSVAAGITNRRHGYNDQATISCLVRVSAGQLVRVRNVYKTSEYYGGISYPFTTFVGFLLRAD